MASVPAQGMVATGAAVATGKVAPSKSILDEKGQRSALCAISAGVFSSATCYMAMMFFALSTAINCVVLDQSIDDPVEQWCVSDRPPVDCPTVCPPLIMPLTRLPRCLAPADCPIVCRPLTMPLTMPLTRLSRSDRPPVDCPTVC